MLNRLVKTVYHIVLRLEPAEEGFEFTSQVVGGNA